MTQERVFKAVEIADLVIQLHGTAILDAESDLVFTAACEVEGYTFLRVGATTQISRTASSEIVLFVTPSQVLDRLTDQDWEELLRIEALKATHVRVCELDYSLSVQPPLSGCGYTTPALFERLLWRVLKQAKTLAVRSASVFHWVQDGKSYWLESSPGRTIIVRNTDQTLISFSQGEALRFDPEVAAWLSRSLERVAYYKDLVLLQECVKAILQALPVCEEWGKCLLLARADDRLILRQTGSGHYLVQRQDLKQGTRTVWVATPQAICLEFCATDLQFCLRALQNYLGQPFFRYLQVQRIRDAGGVDDQWETAVSCNCPQAHRYLIKQLLQRWTISLTASNHAPTIVASMNNRGEVQISDLKLLMHLMQTTRFSTSTFTSIPSRSGAT